MDPRIGGGHAITLNIETSSKLSGAEEFLSNTTASTDGEDGRATLCEECEETPAELSCRNCEQNLCSPCDKRIHNKGARKTHERFPLTQKKPQIQISTENVESVGEKMIVLWDMTSFMESRPQDRPATIFQDISPVLFETLATSGDDLRCVIYVDESYVKQFESINIPQPNGLNVELVFKENGSFHQATFDCVRTVEGTNSRHSVLYIFTDDSTEQENLKSAFTEAGIKTDRSYFVYNKTGSNQGVAIEKIHKVSQFTDVLSQKSIENIAPFTPQKTRGRQHQEGRLMAPSSDNGNGGSRSSGRSPMSRSSGRKSPRSPRSPRNSQGGWNSARSNDGRTDTLGLHGRPDQGRYRVYPQAGNDLTSPHIKWILRKQPFARISDSQVYTILQQLMREMANDGRLMVEYEEFVSLLIRKVGGPSKMSYEQVKVVVDNAERCEVIHSTKRQFGSIKTLTFVSMKLPFITLESLVWVLRSLKRDEMSPNERAIQSRIKESYALKLSSAEWEAIVDIIKHNSQLAGSHKHSTSTPGEENGRESVLSQALLNFHAHSFSDSHKTFNEDASKVMTVAYDPGCNSYVNDNGQSVIANKPMLNISPLFTLREINDETTIKMYQVYPFNDIWKSYDQHTEESEFFNQRLWDDFIDFLKEYFTGNEEEFWAAQGHHRKIFSDGGGDSASKAKIWASSVESVLTKSNEGGKARKHGNKSDLQKMKEMEDSRAIPGGRYGCAQFLRICGPPGLRDCSLGFLSYMVQLAINKDTLRYQRTLLVWTASLDKPGSKNTKPGENEDIEKSQVNSVMIQKKLGKVKSVLIEVLAESRGGISLAQLPQHLKRHLPFNLDLNELGFAKLKDLILSMPTQVKIELRGANHPFATLITKHQHSLSEIVHTRNKRGENQDGVMNYNVYVDRVKTAIVALTRDYPQGISGSLLLHLLSTKLGHTFDYTPFSVPTFYDFLVHWASEVVYIERNPMNTGDEGDNFTVYNKETFLTSRGPNRGQNSSFNPHLSNATGKGHTRNPTHPYVPQNMNPENIRGLADYEGKSTPSRSSGGQFMFSNSPGCFSPDQLGGNDRQADGVEDNSQHKRVISWLPYSGGAGHSSGGGGNPSTTGGNPTGNIPYNPVVDVAAGNQFSASAGANTGVSGGTSNVAASSGGQMGIHIMGSQGNNTTGSNYENSHQRQLSTQIHANVDESDNLHYIRYIEQLLSENEGGGGGAGNAGSSGGFGMGNAGGFGGDMIDRGFGQHSSMTTATHTPNISSNSPTKTFGNLQGTNLRQGAAPGHYKTNSDEGVYGSHLFGGATTNAPFPEISRNLSHLTISEEGKDTHNNSSGGLESDEFYNYDGLNFDQGGVFGSHDPSGGSGGFFGDSGLPHSGNQGSGHGNTTGGQYYRHQQGYNEGNQGNMGGSGGANGGYWQQ